MFGRLLTPHTQEAATIKVLNPHLFPEPAVVMEVVTDPEELARNRAHDERFRRNLEWYSHHALKIGDTCGGKHICIAAQELFVADSPQEAWAKGMAAHPEDDGLFVKYVSTDRTPRI